MRPRRNPEVVWREEPRGAARAREEGVETPCATLVHLGTMFQLNLVATELWKLCDGTRTPGELVDALLEVFDVERDVLAGDVARFLDDMGKKGWLLDGTAA